MEILKTLGINWTTLVAQMVNFGILLAALMFLLYRPIMRLLDERRERIEKSMNDAKKISEQVKQMEQSQAKAMKDMDAKASAILAEAKKQAEASKAQILAVAQSETDAFVKKGREQLENDRRSMVADLEKSVAALTVKLAGKVLQREFTDTDQKRMLTSLEKDIPSLIK